MDIEKMKKLTPQVAGEKLAFFWNRFFKLILALFLLAMMAVGGYFWYFNLYRSSWSETEKINFFNAQSKDADLKTEAVEKAVQRTLNKRERFNQETFSSKNIFKAY